MRTLVFPLPGQGVRLLQSQRTPYTFGESIFLGLNKTKGMLPGCNSHAPSSLLSSQLVSKVQSVRSTKCCPCHTVCSWYRHVSQSAVVRRQSRKQMRTQDLSITQLSNQDFCQLQALFCPPVSTVASPICTPVHRTLQSARPDLTISLRIAICLRICALMFCSHAANGFKA